MIDEDAIAERFRALAHELNQRQRRLWAASEGRAAGGGIAAAARATGMSGFARGLGRQLRLTP